MTQGALARPLDPPASDGCLLCNDEDAQHVSLVMGQGSKSLCVHEETSMMD